MAIRFEISVHDSITDLRTIELPYREQDLTDAVLSFERASNSIVREFVAEKAFWLGPKSSRKTVSYAWLKRYSYALIAAVIEEEREDLFEHRLRIYGRYSRREFLKLNAFQKGLLAIFAHDKGRDKTRRNDNDTDPPEILSAKNRHIFGHQMWQAFRHYIPPEFLNGFMWDSGGSVERRGRGGIGRILPQYREWVIEQRSHDEDDVRGRYPMDIQRLADSLRDARHTRDEDWEVD